MASIKFGAIVTDMRGKLGGHVFQKGNQSRVMKTYARPRTTTTVANVTQTAFLKQVQTNWSISSDKVKREYGILSGNISFKNVFGDNVVYSPFQFYLHCNMNAARAGHILPISPSLFTQAFPPTRMVSSAISIGSGTFAITTTGALGSARFQILALRKKNTTQKVQKDNFIWFGQFNASVPPNQNLYSALVSRIGALSVGDTIYVGIIVTNQFGLSKSLEYMQATIT